MSSEPRELLIRQIAPFLDSDAMVRVHDVIDAIGLAGFEVIPRTTLEADRAELERQRRITLQHMEAEQALLEAGRRMLQELDELHSTEKDTPCR